MMKKLSDKTGKEVWINPRYLILRFMKSRKAFKIREFEKTIFTMKPVKEDNIEEQIHIHLRFNGKDLWNNLDDVIDLDVYILKKDFEDAVKKML